MPHGEPGGGVSSRRRGRRVLLAALAFVSASSGLTALFVACSSDKPPLLNEDTSKTPGVPSSGPCVEGATEACDVIVSEHAGVRSCFSGQRTCTGGVWSACGGGSGGTGTIQSVRLPSGTLGGETVTTSLIGGGGASGGLSLASLSNPSGPGWDSGYDAGDAGACANDPCDPTCVGWSEIPDGGVTGDASTTAAWFAPPFTGTVPNGFFSKGMIDCSQSGTPCNLYQASSYGDGGDTWAACQFDTYCNPGTCTTDASSGSCLQYAADGSVPGASAGCSGVDLTAGIACNDPTDGHITFTVCNRGTVTSTAKKMGLDMYGGNSSQFPKPPGTSYSHNGSGGQDCTLSPSPDCYVNLPAIKPGQCTTIHWSDMIAGASSLAQCQGNLPTGSSGNVTVRVNSDEAITECSLTISPYNDAGNTYKGCEDNWTDLHKSAGVCVAFGKSYGPSTYTQRYIAQCPYGTAPQWSLLAYNVTTPSSGGTSSSAIFSVRTAPLLSDGGAGTFGDAGAYVQVAQVPATDPNNCPLSGVTGCPKDLYAALGGRPSVNNGVLDLQVQLNPSTDLQVDSTLNSWQVTYSCPPSQ